MVVRIETFQKGFSVLDFRSVRRHLVFPSVHSSRSLGHAQTFARTAEKVRQAGSCKKHAEPREREGGDKIKG